MDWELGVNAEYFKLNDKSFSSSHLCLIKKKPGGSSYCVAVETNVTSMHENVGSIPGLILWI